MSEICIIEQCENETSCEVVIILRKMDDNDDKSVNFYLCQKHAAGFSFEVFSRVESFKKGKKKCKQHLRKN